MMNDNLNMSIRKFLKEVGVTSQRAIENAWNQADIPEGSTVEAKIVLTIKDLNVVHTVNGKICS